MRAFQNRDRREQRYGRALRIQRVRLRSTRAYSHLWYSHCFRAGLHRE